MKIITIIFAILLGGCASTEIERPLAYCAWSQDDSRWPLHKTNMRNYLIASALGAQESALKELTGGTLKFERKRDREGHVIEVKSNSFGIISAYDTLANCYLTPLAYSTKKVGRLYLKNQRHFSPIFSIADDLESI